MKGSSTTMRGILYFKDGSCEPILSYESDENFDYIFKTNRGYVAMNFYSINVFNDTPTFFIKRDSLFYPVNTISHVEIELGGPESKKTDQFAIHTVYYMDNGSEIEDFLEFGKNVNESQAMDTLDGIIESLQSLIGIEKGNITLGKTIVDISKIVAARPMLKKVSIVHD